MDIIFFPFQEDPPTIYNEGFAVSPPVMSISDKAFNREDIQGLGDVIMQDSQDPYSDSEEMDPMYSSFYDDAVYLSDMNMSPDHEPIFKGRY